MITVTRRIEATPPQLWQLVSDVERWPELVPTVDDVENVGCTGPTREGSRFRVRQPGLVPATYEVTDWRPGESFAWRASTPGLLTVATHELLPDGEGTLLRLSIGWHGPLAVAIRALIGKKARRYVDQEALAFARAASSMFSREHR
ncbi:SRPBCC family protein [Pseudactinotalea terrae]|uniref:SRPBCC family protein n=1 Tax=Pseudactinotalea terrae TaxID=1743262 RepID=UPI0012E26565|nr:SRPBCC family protein [Pseudactinotalea terrae]